MGAELYTIDNPVLFFQQSLNRNQSTDFRHFSLSGLRSGLAVLVCFSCLN